MYSGLLNDLEQFEFIAAFDEPGQVVGSDLQLRIVGTEAMMNVHYRR